MGTLAIVVVSILKYTYVCKAHLEPRVQLPIGIWVIDKWWPSAKELLGVFFCCCCLNRSYFNPLFDWPFTLWNRQSTLFIDVCIKCTLARAWNPIKSVVCNHQGERSNFGGEGKKCKRSDWETYCNSWLWSVDSCCMATCKVWPCFFNTNIFWPTWNNIHFGLTRILRCFVGRTRVVLKLGCNSSERWRDAIPKALEISLGSGLWTFLRLKLARWRFWDCHSSLEHDYHTSNPSSRYFRGSQWQKTMMMMMMMLSLSGLECGGKSWLRPQIWSSENVSSLLPNKPPHPY